MASFSHTLKQKKLFNSLDKLSSGAMSRLDSAYRDYKNGKIDKNESFSRIRAELRQYSESDYRWDYRLLERML
ncbi:MAG: hypothetical protein KC736_02055 [Candidatus Moranbacteria bacterium]|nr:hypothetical protein [Candidatus Moranbacteria bacterium]